jgi:hypothetical protein
VRAAEAAARATGARRRPRRRSLVDPALAERARHAAELATGRPARVLPGRIELVFADETELEELAEVLERLASHERA